MNIDKFRETLIEYNIYIKRDYQVENSHCFECKQMIVFFNEKSQDVSVSFNLETPPKAVAFYILGFLENLPTANNLTVIDSFIETPHTGHVFVDDEEKRAEKREQSDLADNILLNIKGYEC